MKRNVDRYFSGFIKKKVEKKNGKGHKTVLEYHGEYYKHHLSDEEWKKLKRFYPVSALICLAAWIAALASDLGGSLPKYVTVPGLCIIFPIYYFVFGSVRNIFAKREMIVRDYRSSVVRIRWGALLTCILAALTFVCDLVNLLARRGHEVYEYFTALALLLCAAASLAAYIREQRTKYVVKLPPEEEGLL